MNEQEMPYEIFEKYVLRVPLFSFSWYEWLTSEKEIENQKLLRVCRNRIVKEAIFLASPDLYQEMQKWIDGELFDYKRIEKLKYSLLKYLSRMSTRCTPFALFAGCTIGRFGNQTQIELKEIKNHERQTTLDTHFLVSLSKKLLNNPKIRHQLRYYPNNSLYKVGNKLRYFENRIVKGQSNYHISSVDFSK